MADQVSCRTSLYIVISKWSLLMCKQMTKGEVKTRAGLGVAVSTLHATDDPPLSDERKSAFDWCKEGNVDVVKQLLKTNECDTEQLDENVI